MNDLKPQTIPKADLLKLVRESDHRQFVLVGGITSSSLHRLLAHLRGLTAKHGLVRVVILPAESSNY